MKNTKKVSFICLLSVLCLTSVLSESLFAQSERKTIHIAGVEYPPFFLTDGSGAAKDMLTELFDEMGYDVSIQLLPLGRAIYMVNSGKLESAFLFPQTDPEVTVKIPILYSSVVFIYKKSKFPNGVSFADLSDLKGYTIGALTGSRWSIKILQEGAGLKLDFAPGSDMNIRRLYAERIDLLPLFHITALSLMESVLPDKKEDFGLTKPFNVTPLCMIFSTKYPGNKEIIKDVQRKFSKIDMQTIIQKNFGKYFPNGVVPSYMVTGEIK